MLSLALLPGLLAGPGPAAGPAPTPVRRSSEPADHRLVLIEQFFADGAEPTFWLSSTEAGLQRGPGARHPVEFGFRFERFETVLGGEPPAALAVQEGQNRLVIAEDPATQELFVEGDLPVVSFLNDVLGRMEEGLDRSEAWTEPVRVFDGSVLPGFTATEVAARFTSTVVPVGRTVMRLFRFETDEVAFRANGSDVRVSFRGAALVDEDRSLSYHTLFEQAGEVRGEAGTTSLEHVTTMYLEDLGGQPIVPVDAVDGFDEVHSTYRFYSRPELEDVYPHLLDELPRPAWATPTWLAGRIAGGALGGVAEGSVNPVPAMSLGSVVLTDQSIYYAGNILIDRRDFEAGRKSELEIDIHDGEYRSPLQYALAPEGEDFVPMDRRLLLLGPDTRGAARVGSADDPAAVIIPFGIGMEAAAALLGSSSKLAPILSSSGAVQYGTVVGATAGTTAGAGIATSTLLLAGAGAAGVGVAASGGGGGGDGSSGPPEPGNSAALPCNTSVVSGGEGVTSTLHELGPDSGTVAILFEPGADIADELEVFYDGTSVAGTGVPVTGSTTVQFAYVPENEVTQIVVVVDGGVASFWSYTVECPQ